ncbi:GrBNV_gp23-like protein [Drosophila innubila nudivirus]|uniref:GrBNV_gp23-like protein n=1 Tax=Drosophila innubila nudivirus TaxID=2057187 RepID=A0A2H4UX51_9VIRU|nr:GrBNV_gp23-like protein [Drosophila innubila nudivirus]ATZ81501.1 GrBNV_gp23-like protein [Drosophila innubila nudivirus]
MMSALLANDAVEMNLCAEYGYSSRRFHKYPLVYQSNDYRSCLFLMHTQIENIENRKKNYRNHFTLFRNDNSIIVCRTETSLIHADNDAIIIYDCITPSSNVCDRFRSKYKSWNVSFDKIKYSNAYPNFLGYSLLCSGEWWYFDRGIILNGITGYEENVTCSSIFIYYELHIDYVIKMPSKDALLSIPPVINSLTTYYPNNATNFNRVINVKPSNGNTNMQSLGAISTSTPVVQLPVQQAQLQQQQPPPQPSVSRPSLINHSIMNNSFGNSNTISCQLPTFMYITSPVTADSNLHSTELQNPMLQTTMSQPSITTPPIANSTNANIPTAGLQHQNQQPQSQQSNQLLLQSQAQTNENVVISSLPATLLPYINGVVRSTIRQNDTTQTPQVESNAVIPSLYWLDKRSDELRLGKIDYFLPLDYKCPTRGLVS